MRRCQATSTRGGRAGEWLPARPAERPAVVVLRPRPCRLALCRLALCRAALCRAALCRVALCRAALGRVAPWCPVARSR
jgi:hypothetical protein